MLPFILFDPANNNKRQNPMSVRFGTTDIYYLRTTKLHRLEENLQAIDLKLSESELLQISKATSVIAIQDERYSEGIQKMIDR